MTMPVSVGEATKLISIMTQASPGTRVMLGGQGVPRGSLDDGIRQVATVESLIDDIGRLLQPAVPARGRESQGSLAARSPREARAPR